MKLEMKLLQMSELNYDQTKLVSSLDPGWIMSISGSNVGSKNSDFDVPREAIYLSSARLDWEKNTHGKNCLGLQRFPFYSAYVVLIASFASLPDKVTVTVAGPQIMSQLVSEKLLLMVKVVFFNEPSLCFIPLASTYVYILKFICKTVFLW